MNEFSMKPSQLLQLGLDALIEAEQPDSPVKVYMGSFFRRKGELCFACLGGLAVIKYYKMPVSNLRDLNDRSWFASNEEIDAIEEPLDRARMGAIDYMFRYMNLDLKLGATFNSKETYVPYEAGPEEFKNYLRGRITALTAAGY